MNRVQFTGRLVTDLERAETRGGTTVAKGRLAIDRAGQGGETGFIAFESYGPGAEAALKTIGKGWLVGLDGRLQHDQWKNEAGESRQAYKFVGDIEFLAAPQSRGEGREVQQTAEVHRTTEAEAESEQEADPDLEASSTSAEAESDQDTELSIA